MIYLILATFAVIALLEIPRMVSQKWWRELIVFCCLFVSALISCIVLVVDGTLPSPLVWILKFMQDTLHLSY